MGKRGNARI
jgi:hypothetical protein